jgi:cytidyltransferase-like protein
MTDDIVLVTGGFDPIHSGHIAYIKAARELGRVMVGVNSDEWLTRKKGAAFMSIDDRLDIIKNLKDVMGAFTFDDSDGSAKDAITKVREMFPKNKIIFANGGDRTSVNIPEMDTTDTNIEFVFDVGGEDKKNSSSWILSEWKAPKTERPWGYYRVLHIDGHHTKVKELTIMPGKKLSMQRHTKRSEHWMVSEGQCIVNGQLDGGYATPPVMLQKHMNYDIGTHEWHQLVNPFDEPCKIIEIQYGSLCDEMDIERL